MQTWSTLFRYVSSSADRNYETNFTYISNHISQQLEIYKWVNAESNKTY